MRLEGTTMRRLLPERLSFSTPASRKRVIVVALRARETSSLPALLSVRVTLFTWPAADASSTPHAAFHIISPSTRALTHAIATCSGGSPLHGYRKALALAMHKPTTPSTSVDNAMLPSAELTTQCDKANGTPATAAAEAAAMRCTTTRHDDRMEHAHVHALPLSTDGWSTLTPPSPAFLPHAPACDDLERSIIPLFVASSSSLLGLSVASSLSSCTTEDLGTAAVMTTPHGHMAENSTLDSLTGDSQISCPWVGDV
ncbi:hypothetical protein F5148DRAFT_777979 [Russula earlei]|uniref:Uncharacterized protein n=1 Tax=Russula earlei TaxID=71964 RepID=A0ACC0UBZ8_9AGAM|nr:hypothetical protein F5148DRAFT_777979 [Russula earlei]